MELRTLKEGSKTRIVLGACCGNPLSFSAWFMGEEMAFLKKRDRKQDPASASEEDKTTPPESN